MPQVRLPRVLDAVVSKGTDLSLDEVLAGIVDIAREVAGARYAALGVLDPGPGRGLRMFVHAGLGPAEVARIGALPTGHGVLGLLIDHPEPVRLHDISHHPRAHGFPPDHPPMGSFLGVPVRIRGRVFGNLYLTEKLGSGDFTQADEDVVVALASAAGVAIENARLHEEAARREGWLAATAAVTGLLTGSVPAEEALHAVAASARGAADADVAWIVTGAAGDLVVTAFAGAGVPLADVVAVPLGGTLSERVVATGEPVTVVDLPAPGHPHRVLGVEGLPVLGSAIIVPLRTRDVVVGALALAWTPERVDRFHEVDPRLPAGFAEQAGLALQMVQAHDAEQRVAVLEDRDRIGRDLHDLVIQRLFAVGLGLQAVSRSTSDPLTAEQLEGAVDDLDATIRDVRRSIFALEAPADSADLQSEVTRLVERAAATMKLQPSLRLEGPLRTMVTDDQAPHLLAVLGEALSNAARHADAAAIEVRITAGEDLRLVVSDDGRGVPAGARESGLRHMRERAALLGGTCVVESSGAGTTVTWSVPWAPPAGG